LRPRRRTNLNYQRFIPQYVAANEINDRKISKMRSHANLQMYADTKLRGKISHQYAIGRTVRWQLSKSMISRGSKIRDIYSNIRKWCER